MKALVTGVTGYIGSVLVPRLQREGFDVRGFARRPELVTMAVPVVKGDAVTGAGLERALDGVDVAYFLIHSMERAGADSFQSRERIAAQRFADVARAAGVRRIVYLGGPEPRGGARSAHLASRLAVEGVLLGAIPDSVALRASIVIGARSRSFRFLVRLVERLPVMAMPAWSTNRTQPIDERDVVELLVAAATSDAAAGLALDVSGPDVVSYGELIERIAELMLVGRPAVRFSRLTVTPIASRVAAVIAGEDADFIEPLMQSLGTDLLPQDNRASQLLRVRLHSLNAAIEHALSEWERAEPLAAR
ncbi:MAG: NAD(P)H-binding protein [Solirubrobacteraceae bacterium]